MVPAPSRSWAATCSKPNGMLLRSCCSRAFSLTYLRPPATGPSISVMALASSAAPGTWSSGKTITAGCSANDRHQAAVLSGERTTSNSWTRKSEHPAIESSGYSSSHGTPRVEFWHETVSVSSPGRRPHNASPILPGRKSRQRSTPRARSSSRIPAGRQPAPPLAIWFRSLVSTLSWDRGSAVIVRTSCTGE